MRDNDKIKRVLNDDKFLQFTHKLFKKYIRLLMPEYERTVEIEDLNRNFWVIGQVLTGILSFLFDEKSPLNDIFEGFLDEIAQLWENLLYLWVAFALISQEINNDVQVLVIPVNNDELRPCIKFDDFQGETELSEDFLKKVFADKMCYLKDIYNKSTVVIIPEVRQCNYLKNYYAKVTYPGVIVYNRKYSQGVSALLPHNTSNETPETEVDEKLVYYPIELNTDNSQKLFCVDMSGGETKIGEQKIMLEVMGIYEKTPYYNFVTNYMSGGIEGASYIGAVRTVFSVDNSSKPPVVFTEGKISEIGLKAECIDVARELFDAPDDAGKTIMSVTLSLNSDGMKVTGSPNFSSYSISLPVDKKEIVKGWYRGEVVSYYHINNPEFTITINKQWQNMNSTTPTDEEVIVNIAGKDSLGIKSETIKRNFNAEENDPLKEVSVVKYSGSGRLIDYTIAEDDQTNQYWERTGENTLINADSTNKTATLINTWKGPDFDDTLIPITKVYGSTKSQKKVEESYLDITNFFTQLSTPKRKNKWVEYVKNAVEQDGDSYSKLSDNSVGFYYAHYQFYDDNDALTEVMPYVTIVIKEGDSTKYYSFEYKVTDNNKDDSIHSDIVCYPYISSVYKDNNIVAPSTERLCQWNNSADPSSGSVVINTPRKISTEDYSTKGSLIYGYGTRKKEKESGKETQEGIKFEFRQDGPYLYNYLILGCDRACVGVDTTDDFKNDELVEEPTRVKALFPYYYRCSIKNGAQSNGEFGEITAIIQYNKKTESESYGLTLTGDFATGTYSWEEDINKRRYSSADSSSSNEPNLTDLAQLAMGKVEKAFLKGKKQLSIQGGEEEGDEESA